MKATDLQELAAAYAVGALESTEAARLEAAVAPDPGLRRELAALLDVAATMAARTTPVSHPPAAIREAVLARIATTPQLRRPVAPPAPTPPRPGFYFLEKHEGALVEPLPGVTIKELSVDRNDDRATLLINLAPGTHYPVHHHSGGEDCFVVSGDFHVEGRCLRGGDFHHADANTDHRESFTESGCQLLVVVAGRDYLPKT